MKLDRNNRNALFNLLVRILLCLSLTLGVYGSPYYDPTRPTGYVESFLRFNVSFIKINSQTKSAVVNGKTVTVGSQLDSYRVIDISPNSVTLQTAKKKWTIYMNQGIIEKIPS